MPQPAEDWERLGQLLQQRRVELNPDWKNRAEFTRANGINYRLAQDIETAARDNYDPPTRAFIEDAYRWEPGSIVRVLAGGDPAPKDLGMPIFADPDEQAVALKAWNENAALADDPESRRLFSLLAVRLYRRRANGGSRGAEDRRRRA